MVSTPEEVITFQGAPPRYSQGKRIIQVFLKRKISLIGLIIIFLLLIMAVFAPLLAPYNPYETDLTSKLDPPSSEHWLGTDAVGRDILSRIIYASRTSLLVAIGAVCMSAVIGQTLGLIAAFYQGWVSNIIMRFIDSLMGIPMLILALVIAAVLGGGVKNVIIALGIGGISAHCRMMCGQAMSIRENDYILAGQSVGLSNLRIMLRHIFPNAFPPLLVMMTIGLGQTILSEAGLSFLGVGISPPETAWGSMISDGYRFLLTNPLISLAPGVAILLVVFGFNMLGDGLRDALDPRLRGIV
jgi:ABC-type dipeptide/oligopeptide/nickel transport system permease subunit